MNINEILAKSCEECENKYLINHTKMVVNYGLFLGNKLFNEHKKNILYDEKESFLKELAIALAIHDLGKCTDAFQKSLKKIKFTDDGSEESNSKLVYNHNVLSWAYAISRLNLGTPYYSPITSSILYHHVVYTSNDNELSSNILLSLSNDEISRFDEFYKFILSYIQEVHNFEYGDEFAIHDDISKCSTKSISSETLFDSNGNISQNSILDSSKRALMRACVILADRTVSSGNYDFEKIINNDYNYFESLYKEITECNSVFGKVNIFECGYDNNRLKSQVDIINEINNSDVNHSIISASAGFGKTLMGIIWFITNNKKLTWVLPRNVIADGTYRSVIEELGKIGILDNVKVALFRSGEIIKSNCNLDEDDINKCDILITNIDSILNRNIKNNMSNQLVNIYSSNMIFDEFHEFLGKEPLFPSFIRLMQTRAFYTKSNTILLSATPMKLDFCGINENENLIKYYGADIFNGDMNVNIKVLHLDSVDDLVIEDKDAFIITNTVQQSQDIYSSNGDGSTLLHARFTDDDRSRVEDSVYISHGKKSDISKRNLIVGTNLIGTGLDISAKSIYDFVLSPESTIQRCCGRGGRYGEKEYNNEINYYVCVLNENSKGVIKLINQTFSKSLHNNWISLLESLDGKTVTKSELYDMYYSFYEKNKIEVNELYNDFYLTGNEYLPLMKPKKSSKKTKESDTKIISNSLSFRGSSNNVFVTAIDDETNDWCEPIVIDKVLFEYGDENKFTLKRKEAILNSGKFNYPSKKSLERGFNIKFNSDFNIEKCERFAFSSISPLPLFTFKYNSKLGLYKIE